MVLKRNKVTISGIVQRVFFRRFIYQHATKLGLKGYVKNTDDGKVEAVFEGKEDKVKEIIELCRKGPEAARVENIKIVEEKIKNEKYFVRKA